MKSARDQKLKTLKEFRVRVHRIRVYKKVDLQVWEATWRAKDRWEKRWSRWMEETLETIFNEVDLEDAVSYAMKLQKSKRGRVRKDADRDALVGQLIERIQLDMDPESWVRGAATSYIQIALDTGETAGQYSLDSLGINRTFSWANPRNMGRDIYAVRGSKVVQHAHGTHVANLSRVIVDATNPAAPQSIGQIVKQIRADYPQLARWQAERIARTETAAIWENMNMNTMLANDVPGANVLVASGPSIGVSTMPVCDICTELVSDGPWSPPGDAPVPPFHPNCRCTLVPELTYDDGTSWLPPADTWTGGEFADIIPLEDL